MLTGNHADGSSAGGGIAVFAGSPLTIDDSVLTGNHADNSGFGGGILIVTGSAEIDYSAISVNSPNDLAFVPALGGSAHLKQTVVGATLYRDATLS